VPNLEEITFRNTSVVSWFVFVSTVSLSVLVIIATIFPAFFVTLFGGRTFSTNVNPFELGIMGIPIILVSVIFIGLLYLYTKKSLPILIHKGLNYLNNFEISAHLALFLLVIILGIYISSSFGELFDGKFEVDYEERVKSWLKDFDVFTIGPWGIGGHLHVLLGVLSIQIFDNPKVIPFLSSVTLILLTYFITKELSGKRFSGIIASVVLLQSTVFLNYDTDITYPNFWIMFYLLSLLLLKKLWQLSAISWVCGILSKILTGAFLPMTLFFIYRLDMPKRKKIYSLLSYAAIVVLGLVFLNVTGSSPQSGNFHFDIHDALGGISSISYSLRFDILILVLMIPVVIGLFLRSKWGNASADSVNFLIFGMLLSGIMVPAVGLNINVPYRFVPLIVFVAVGVGMCISSKVKTENIVSNSA
jgi:hypothetical protein